MFRVSPKPSDVKYAMIGEFGGVGAFVQGKEWVPGKCHTYLKVDTPADEANTYIAMAKTILGRRVCPECVKKEKKKERKKRRNEERKKKEKEGKEGRYKRKEKQ